jgi:hypothetical protein
MKKIILSFALFTCFSFAYGQDQTHTQATAAPKTDIETAKTDRIRPTGSEKSVAAINYSAFHEIAGPGTNDGKVHLLIKETGINFPRIRMIGSASTPANDRFWDIRGDVYEPTITDDFLFFKYGSLTYPSMSLNPNAKVGIGIATETKNLHVHENNNATAAIIKLTTAATGAADTDGLELQILGNDDFLSPNAARVMNKENTQLFLGTNNFSVMNITPTGNVGINSLFGGAPTARFQVFHDTQNDATKPHINLVTSVNANNGMIKMTNLTSSRYFGQYFNLNSATPANNFVSFDYNGTTPILDMQGNGNVKISGFTTLGDDALAPRIKMKKLTSTFSANANSAGTPTFIAHGVATTTKVISISVLGQYLGSGGYVSNSFLTSNGYQFDYQIDGTNIIVTPKMGNSASLVSQNIKVVITYEE